MSISVPAFPLLGEPGEWDDLTLAASTIFLEAEGEPDEGKVAIAWVIRTRMRAGGTVHTIILGSDGRAYADGRAYEPWSCWNDDYVPIARARLAAAPEARREACWRAAAGGLWGLIPDPTSGANFYLNPELTKKIRKGTMPSWYAPEKVVVRIGRHEFLRLS